MGYIWPENWPYHGTTNGYSSYDCRCDLCKEAVRLYRRERRAANLDRLHENGGMTTGIKHGAAAYNENLCRCNVCRTQATAQKAESKARRIQRQAEEFAEAQKLAPKPKADELPDDFEAPEVEEDLIGLLPLRTWESMATNVRPSWLAEREDWRELYDELVANKVELSLDDVKRLRHDWLRQSPNSGQENAGERGGLPEMPSFGYTHKEYLEMTGARVPGEEGIDYTETNGGF